MDDIEVAFVHVDDQPESAEASSKDEDCLREIGSVFKITGKEIVIMF